MLGGKREVCVVGGGGCGLRMGEWPEPARLTESGLRHGSRIMFVGCVI